MNGIALEVVKHTEAKRGFILLPRRWVVEALPGPRDSVVWRETLAGFHYLAFACLMLHRIIPFSSA